MFRGSEVQRFRGSEVQRFKGLKGSKVQKFRIRGSDVRRRTAGQRGLEGKIK